MALPFGLYASPGATKRSIAFEKERSQALDVAEPLVARSLRDAFKPPEQSALERFQRFERSDRLEFEPSRSPSGLFSDRLGEQPESRRQFQERFPGEDVPGTVPQGEPPREPGIPSLIEDVFRQVGRVAGGPEEAFLPENAGGLAPPIPRQLVDVETRAATRYAALLEETRQSFPAKTPPGTTIESLALERLDEEMGEELRAAQPQGGKGLFGKLLSAGLRGTEALVFGRPGGAKEALEAVGAGIGELEKTPAGGPFFRQPRTGKTAFEEGAEISRPVVQAAQPIAAEPFEQVEAAGIPVVSPAAGGVATAIQSQIVEDIGTEVINPAALVLVAPIALQAASGLRGVAAAEALVSNLLATGLEPALVRGTLRGLTVLGRDGLAGLSKLSKAVRETPIMQEAIRGLREGEQGGGRLAGDVPPLRGGEGVPLDLPDELRLYSEGVPPPREPPIAPPEGPPSGPSGLPERGSSGAQQVLDFKEETLLKPGRVTQFPGIKQAASGLNPSVPLERNVLVSYNARQAAAASLETEFAAARQSPLDDLKAVFRDDPPRYVGPDDNPFKKTLKDWGDNPEFYTLSPRHRAAAAAYDASSSQTLNRARGEFGVDINPFPVKTGGFYVPTVPTRESLEEGLKKVAEGYTSASVSARGGRAKTRVFEGAYQRWKRNPGFKAETNIDELTGLHDQALAKMSGNETFKLGTGGKTRIETVDLTHPGLRQAKEAVAQKMTNLRARIDTAIRQIKQTGTAGKRLDTAVRQAEKRTRPILERIDDLGDEWGPELSHLSGQAREINARAEALRKVAGKVGGRGTAARLRLTELQAEVRKLEPLLERLRKGYAAANLDPYVLNGKTFRYHLAEQSAAIDNILQTRLNIGQGLADAIDEVRLTAFAGDFSPLTIQGLLGGLSHPLTTATNSRNIVKALWNPDELLRIASREPELVQRFTRATGRPFGEVGPEFIQRFKGLERLRIPGTDLRPIHAMNSRLMAAVEEIRYAAWKTDQDLLRRLNPGMTQNVADTESANMLSKMIPALNPAETGRSVLRARFERIPIISTSFLASPVALTKDMASGLAKLGASTKLSPLARWQALSGREQLAILRGLNLAGSLSALTVGSYVASGFSPEEAVKKALDPTGNNPRFLSIAIGKDRYIPIGGPVRSFIRALVPTKVGEAEGVPIYAPFRNLSRWIKAKGTPGIKAPIDLIRNKDFFGGKIATGSFPENILRAVWYGANSVLPLAAAEPSEAIRRGEVAPTDIGELAIRGGGQLAGSDIRELRLREAFERETGLSYSETPSFRRRELIAASPFLTRLAEQQEVFFPNEGADIRTDRSAELLPGAQAVLQGLAGAGVAYNDNRSGIMARFGGISAAVFGDLDIKPKGRDNELLDEYYSVDFNADLNGNGVPGDEADKRLAAEERDRIFEQISPAVQRALKNPSNFFPEADVAKVETMRKQAIDAIKAITALPKYDGLNVEESERVDDFRKEVRQETARIKRESAQAGMDPDKITFRMVAQHRAEVDPSLEEVVAQAIILEGGAPVEAFNTKRIDLAFASQDLLATFYPGFLASVLPIQAERALGEKAFEGVIQR